MLSDHPKYGKESSNMLHLNQLSSGEVIRLQQTADLGTLFPWSLHTPLLRHIRHVSGVHVKQVVGSHVYESNLRLSLNSSLLGVVSQNNSPFSQYSLLLDTFRKQLKMYTYIIGKIQVHHTSSQILCIFTSQSWHRQDWEAWKLHTLVPPIGRLVKNNYKGPRIVLFKL